MPGSKEAPLCLLYSLNLTENSQFGRNAQTQQSWTVLALTAHNEKYINQTTIHYSTVVIEDQFRDNETAKVLKAKMYYSSNYDVLKSTHRVAAYTSFNVV